MSKLSPAIRKETMHVGVATGMMVIAMWAVFFILHRFMPDQVPFDYKVILGGLCGGFVAVLNFFLMALTVQKVVATEDGDLAKARMKSSYSQRMLMQIVWIVIAIAAPCFHFVAGIVPLLFPSLGIRIMSLLGIVK